MSLIHSNPALTGEYYDIAVSVVNEEPTAITDLDVKVSLPEFLDEEQPHGNDAHCTYAFSMKWYVSHGVDTCVFVALVHFVLGSLVISCTKISMLALLLREALVVYFIRKEVVPNVVNECSSSKLTEQILFTTHRFIVQIGSQL